MCRWLAGSLLALMLCAQHLAAAPVLVVGDSISAAFGLDTASGWVALLEQRMREKGYEQPVVNASISGDTSSGGLSRLPRLLREHSPELVIIELGGNDGLRGQHPRQLQHNLAAMIDLSSSSGAQVLLLGMQIPPNYGRRYTEAFAQVYPQLAEEKQVVLVPFFLEGVAGVPGMMQSDGIHPTLQAQPQLLENVWPFLAPLL